MSNVVAEAREVRASWYYGWTIVGVAALAMVGTLPGRTQGLGLVAEPMMADLAIDRVTLAEINFVATLAGSAFCFGVGSLMDRHGARLVASAIALLLGAVVLLTTLAHGVSMLLVLLTLTRGLGQSALSVVSISMPGKWFRRRLTWAMGVYALLLSVGFMLAFPAVGAVVLASGWRAAWGLIGLALVAGLAPLAWFLIRKEPTANDELSIDDALTSESGPPDVTLGAALETPAFWVVAVSSACYGLVASGIGLFNESILLERGFAPTIYHQALAVTAIAGLAGNFGAGAWADRGSFRAVLVLALVVMSLGLAALPRVATPTHVMAQAVAMGISGGCVTVVFFSFFGRAYGRTQLGRIQGVAQALTVGASALGPVLLARSAQATGTYAVTFYWLAVVFAVLALAALMVKMPATVGRR